MKIKNSIKMAKQPLLWKQAALRENPRGWTWKNIVFYPIHSYLYTLKNNPSILVDELILGSNPILNLLSLYKISQSCLETKEHKKVGMFWLNQVDYWGYEIIQSPQFFAEIKELYGINVSTVEELVTFVLNDLLHGYLNVYIINDEKMRINYYNKDEYMNGWVFHLLKSSDVQISEVNTFIKIQNDIKKMINDEFFKQCDNVEAITKIRWINMTDKNYPIILAQYLMLTSLPQGWMNIKSEEDGTTVRFKHDGSECSYGSALSISTNPELLRINSLTHLKL